MQQTFLAEVASKLYEQYGNEISTLTIVLPSRRARLFFSESLSHLADKPIWQPEYLSIDDVMSQAASYKKGDKIRIITELYKIYSQHHNESFDKFYFWGEMLLSDFDLIDKYMIDADMLFCNISDLKELEADLSYLTPEMLKVLNNFWDHFDKEESALSTEKRKFLKIWKSLSVIYHQFKERLSNLGFAYPGMIYRSAAENLKQGIELLDLSKRYVFIGFNALSECEKQILEYISRNGQCQFFWDYDTYYTSPIEAEAGRFMRDNIKQFNSKHSISCDNFLKIKKRFTAISTVSNITQCKYVNTILKEISEDLEFDKQTAIVLTDESLLTPLLHSLPDKVAQNVNITMGYPLRQTTAYSFFERLIELQKNCRHGQSGTNFYHIDVEGILSHPFIAAIEPEKAKNLYQEIIKQRQIRVRKELFADSELLSLIFSQTDSWQSLSEYLLEVINKIIFKSIENDNCDSCQQSYLSLLAENITKITNCVINCDIELGISIFTSLVRRHLQTIRIPYSGEPLQGLQVMGILETRNLDFKNVIILSMNDDNFPGNLADSSSFIPYNLRAAYGIPTPEHHEGVYAYYFYRLIQRAERVDMLYCSHADDKTTGEQSRYIYQLEYESPYAINRTNVGVDVRASNNKPIIVEKRGETLSKLMHFLDTESQKMLSPKALSPYIVCPLKFYFASVARLKTTEELADEIDNPMFGTILHSAIEALYKPIKGVADNTAYLKRLLKGDQIEQAVEQAINKEFLNQKEASLEEYTGNMVLVKNIVSKYIRQGIIPYDITHNNFVIMELEKRISSKFKLADGREVLIGGFADRIDSLNNGSLRVVDYKTGTRHAEIAGIESLFEGDKRINMGNLLQTMLYSMVLNHTTGRNVEPALYFVRHMVGSEDYNPRITDNIGTPRNSTTEVDYLTYAEEFEQRLSNMLNEIFDPDIPFTQCSEDEADKVCKYCDFKTICKR